MLDGYHQNGSGMERRQRIIAVGAALEIIKATISAPVNAKNADYDLEVAVKYIEPLADAIQAAISKSL